LCEYIGDPSQAGWGPTRTDRRALSVATGNYVTDRSAGYENQALHVIHEHKFVPVLMRKCLPPKPGMEKYRFANHRKNKSSFTLHSKQKMLFH